MVVLIFQLSNKLKKLIKEDYVAFKTSSQVYYKTLNKLPLSTRGLF